MYLYYTEKLSRKQQASSPKNTTSQFYKWFANTKYADSLIIVYLNFYCPIEGYTLATPCCGKAAQQSHRRVETRVPPEHGRAAGLPLPSPAPSCPASSRPPATLSPAAFTRIRARPRHRLPPSCLPASPPCSRAPWHSCPGAGCAHCLSSENNRLKSATTCRLFLMNGSLIFKQSLSHRILTVIHF